MTRSSSSQYVYMDDPSWVPGVGRGEVPGIGFRSSLTQSDTRSQEEGWNPLKAPGEDLPAETTMYDNAKTPVEEDRADAASPSYCARPVNGANGSESSTMMASITGSDSPLKAGIQLPESVREWIDTREPADWKRYAVGAAVAYILWDIAL